MTKPAPAFDRALLASYASAALGRPIRPEDPEVDEYQEALDGHTFARGGRTSTGYYLDVMITGIPGTSLKPKLKSANEIMRMNNEVEYRGYRNDWFNLLEYAIPPSKRPSKPLAFARVMFRIITPKSPKHLLDIEAKKTAVGPLMSSLILPETPHQTVTSKASTTKALLDGLQPSEVFKGSGKAVTRRGLGVLLGDTDGEFWREGVVRQLEVQQIYNKSLTAVQLIIEEVLD